MPFSFLDCYGRRKVSSPNIGCEMPSVWVHKYQEMVYTYVFQKVEQMPRMSMRSFCAYRNLYQLRIHISFALALYNHAHRWLVRVTKTRQAKPGEDATEEAVRIDPKYTTPTRRRFPANDSRVAVSMFYMVTVR